MRTQGDRRIVAGFIGLALLGGMAAAFQSNLMIGLVAAVLVGAVTVAKPQIGIAGWLAFTLVVPSWTLIPVGGTVIGPTYLALLIVLAVTARHLHDRVGGGAPFPLTLIDGGVTLGVVLVVAYHYAYGQELFLMTNVIVALFGAYILGRMAGVSLQKVFAVAMILVAVWGIIEFALGLHVFEHWQAESGSIGAVIQERGGFARSEASFGHAIAYGAALVAALPFTRTLSRPLLWQGVLAAGVLVSFSRGPMLALVVTFAIMLYTEKDSTRKVTAGLIAILGGAAALTIINFIYTGSAQSEVTNSTWQRDRQISLAVDQINIIGPADGAYLNAEGRYVTNGVDIVDSVPVRLGLDFGWLACALLLLPVALAVWSVALRRGGFASAAVAGQIPVLLTASFITQWQVVFMFLCGMTVAEWVRARTTTRNPVSRPEGVWGTSLLSPSV